MAKNNKTLTWRFFWDGITWNYFPTQLNVFYPLKLA